MKKFWRKFLHWRLHQHNNYYLLLFLSIITGFGAGLAAVVIKNTVHFIKLFIDKGIPSHLTNYLNFIYPIIGIFLVVVFIKYILKQNIGDGIPKILYAISRNSGFIKAHNLFSSIVSSALTVGFGGSVGLEGPTVATGGAIGANIGKMFKLSYRQKILLLGAASAGAMSAIFKAPIAGVVFSLEVIMIDLTTQSIIPILLASVSGSLTSYLFLGTNVLYKFTLIDKFHLNQTPYFILLGIIAGFIAVYFTETYNKITNIFERMENPFKRLLIGGGLLGVLIVIFPALYGEGYETINSALRGDFSYLFNHSIFYSVSDNFLIISLMFMFMLLFKIVATSLTFGAGGIGGIFAPTLFTGANTGLFTAFISSKLGYQISFSNSALVGMAGLIAGVLQAPLTGIFLIGEITQGYGLLFPLMITATVSFIIVRIFEPNNIYSIQLAKRNELFTHNSDKNILSLLELDRLIEKNFKTVKPNWDLEQLLKVVSESERNLFPVVSDDGTFLGIVSMNRIRKIMFKPELYSKIHVKELMFSPDSFIEYKKEDAAVIAEKLQKSNNFNIVVLDNNKKYIGFISRANFFSHYRKLLREFAAD